MPIPEQVYRKVLTLPWQQWFAWYPVKIKGQRVWLKTIYRRSVLQYADMDNWHHWEYGTLFDVIKSS
jgi:hypothetical protein